VKIGAESPINLRSPALICDKWNAQPPHLAGASAINTSGVEGWRVSEEVRAKENRPDPN
jgi:hypothetical protein